MKYHVSRDGEVRQCRSRGPCPLGTSFDGKGDAESYIATRSSESERYTQAIKDERSYSEREAIVRGQFVNDTVSQHLDNKRDTESLYFDRDTKEYNKKRSKIHREILNELHEKYKDVPSERKVIFSAGLPGAGKTTILNMLEDDGAGGVNVDNYVTVSSDDFKEIFAERGMIPKIDGLTPMESSTLVHAESSHLADKFLTELSEKNKNVVYDFTCRNLLSTTARINILRKSGYKERDMQFIFVDISLKAAEKRAIGRYTAGLNDGIANSESHVGGRYLPPAILHRNKSKSGNYSSVNAETLIEVYESNKESGLPKPIVYDNSGNIFTDPTYIPERIDFDQFESRGESKLAV